MASNPAIKRANKKFAGNIHKRGLLTKKDEEEDLGV
jgi:hypothetical protein